jgi:L-rhamnonate dehydratase
VTVTGSRIAAVDVIVLGRRDDAPGGLDASSETVVVRIVDDDGRVGIGEADAAAAVVRELVVMDDVHAWSRGLAGMLVGRDPFQIEALHAELYAGTIYHGRRGLGIHALSAVDIALYDLVGKQLGRPAYHLLGGARRPHLTPYATIYAGPVGERTLAEVVADLQARSERALELGFRAVKLEPLYEHLASDRELVGTIRELRGAIGAETVFMLDFGYRWHDWRQALWTLRRCEEYDVYFAEATLQHDDLAGHAKLAARLDMRICGAELAATVFECREWLERGGVDVLQPDPARCGGLTELRRIVDLAALHGAQVSPHGWKTGINAAAARHFQAATPNAPYIEMFHPALYDSPLRAQLTAPEPEIVDGTIALPTAPGLGVELVDEAVERLRAS